MDTQYTLPKMKTKAELIQFLNDLPATTDYNHRLVSAGYTPKTPGLAELFYKYLLQGLTDGLSGDKLKAYAEVSAARLAAKMPYLYQSHPEGKKIMQEVTETLDTAGDIALATLVAHLTGDAPVVPDAFKAKADQPKVEPFIPEPGTVLVAVDGKPAPAPTPKPAPAPAKKTAVKAVYNDFDILYRADRNGYEGRYGGKAEAFRSTLEQVNAFFAKKYGRTGTLINPQDVPTAP